MDHLFWPEQNPLPRPKVPYLCAGREEILCNDIDCFARWPELMGWNLDLTIGFLESATIFQAWIQFGLLRCLVEATGRTFNLQEFIIEESGRQYVNSMRIKDIIQFKGIGIRGITSSLAIGYYRSYLLESADEVEWHTKLWLKLTEILRQHSSWILQVIQHWEAGIDHCDPWSTETYNVFWSTLLLLEQISDRREDKIQYIHSRRPEIDRLFEHIPLLPPNTLCIENGLKLLGRCPSLSKRTNLSSLEAFRLYTIPANERITHEDCQARACIAFNINTSTYKTRHADKCNNQGCCMQRVNLAIINDLIESDAIPIVSSTLSSDGHVVIKIVDAAEGTGFTAISHVWAGGLGNFEENALYQCQLDQIHADLLPSSSTPHRKSQRTANYWLDTLCIPAHDQRLKKKAIDTMAFIYAKAESVLVLDPELKDIQSRELPEQTIGLAFSCSPWMARSWTLQEGALAVDLQLKFADRVVPFSTINSSTLLSRKSLIQGLWSRNVDRIGTADTQRQMRHWFAAMDSTCPINDDLPPTQSHEMFTNLWNELSRRSSTKSDDLVAILAALLGQSAGEVLQLSGNNRMQALLRAQSSLPFSLLFAPQDDRFTSWCPAFPTCQLINSELSRDLGVMEFTVGGTLQIIDMRGVKILQCDEKIPLVGDIRIHDSTRDNTYHVAFKEASLKHLPSSKRDVIFVIPDTDVGRHRMEKQVGLRFSWSQDNDNDLQWTFVKAFECAICDIPRKLAGGDNLLEDHDSADEQDHAFSPSASTFLVASPFLPSEISQTNPLRVEIGIDEWPILSWSRPDFYPFIQSSLRTARALNFILSLAFMGKMYLAAICSGKALYALYFERSIGWCIFYATCYFFIKKVRDYIAQFEHQSYRGLINKHLQSIWAESFSSKIPERQYVGPQRRLGHILITIGLAHFVLFTLSAAVTTSLFISFCRRVPPDLDHGLIFFFTFFLVDTEPIIILNVLKYIFACTFIELFSRLIAIIYFDPLGLWTKQNPSAAQESAGSKYAWAISSLRVIFPLLLVPSWVLFIRNGLDLRHAKHEEYKIAYPMMLVGNIPFAGVSLMAIRQLYLPLIVKAMASIRRAPRMNLPRASNIVRQWWRGGPDREIQL